MSVAPPTQPVIPYAEAATGGDALHWRGTDEGGVELTIAPPALWRQVLWPSLALGFLTAVILLAGFLALLSMLSVPAGSAILGLLCVTALGAWAVMLARLWRAGRYGRLPSVVRVSARAFQVVAPSLPRETLRAVSAEAIAELLIDSWVPFPGGPEVIRVRIWFHSGVGTEFRIPWRGGQPVAPVERRVREVLRLPVQPES